MKKITLIILAIAVVGFMLASCGEPANPQSNSSQSQQESSAAADSSDTKAADTTAEDSSTSVNAAPSPEDTAGFEEISFGEEYDLDALHVAGVYFQPVDMEPAGNSLDKKDADCHIEADIHANEQGTKLGYGKDEFVPYLKVKCELKKEGSDKVQEIAFMPMNASDGPHYGANAKFEEGLGKYHVKFIISPPGNDYLLHVDKETGVEGRFWTEPIVAEWDIEWKGPQW